MANLRSAIVGLGLGLGLAAAVVGCGGDKAAPSGGAGTGSSAGSGKTAVAALAMPALGVDAVKRLNYEYGPGAKEAKALATAYAAKPRDWAAVRAAAEATLAKDPDHLDARWRLGEALANTGQPAQANAALAAVLAADWLGRGPGLETTPTLTAHLATPDGAALLALAGQLRDAVATHVAGSPWVLARRSGWKQPAPGTSYAATRGELYAVDPIAKRFVRLTHTDHSVAAYLRAPSGEVLLAGFTQAEVPDPAKAAKTAAPILTRAWLRTWNPADPAAPGVKATLGKARYAWVGYGKGEQLVVVTAPAAGRWAPGPQQGFVVDRGTGKLTKGPVVPFEGPAIELSLEDVRVGGDASFPAEDVLAPAVRDQLTAAVDVDDRGQPALASAALSPGGARLAFASATDPCAKGDAAALPSLYVADAKTGAYKHVLTASSRFGLRWLDDDRLLYEDGSGALRLYDAAAARELGKLTERAGLALHALTPTAAPLCRSEPIVDDPSATDDVPEPADQPASDPAAP
jgi:hypothetical protein